MGQRSGEAATDVRIDDVDRGTPVTTVHTSLGTLTVPHVLDNTTAVSDRSLQGTWEGLDTAVVFPS